MGPREDVLDEGGTDRGAIAPGRRADLVALSPDLELEQLWIGGSNVAF